MPLPFIAPAFTSLFSPRVSPRLALSPFNPSPSILSFLSLLPCVALHLNSLPFPLLVVYLGCCLSQFALPHFFLLPYGYLDRRVSLLTLSLFIFIAPT